MRNVGDLEFGKTAWAVFASGPSVTDMPVEEVWAVRSRCSTVFLNYAMCRFGCEEMDVLAWNDWSVSDWLSRGGLKPGVRLWSSEAAFPFGEPAPLMDDVDCWFDSSFGNFTLTNVLRDLRKFHPTRDVLLFGVDFEARDDEAKWYDRFVDEDKKRRRKDKPFDGMFEAQRRELALLDGSRIWNCNLSSKLDVFKKSEWREALRCST